MGVRQDWDWLDDVSKRVLSRSAKRMIEEYVNADMRKIVSLAVDAQSAWRILDQLHRASKRVRYLLGPYQSRLKCGKLPLHKPELPRRTRPMIDELFV